MAIVKAGSACRVKLKWIYVLTPLLFVQAISAQSKLKVIKATSRSVAINDGGYLDKNAWSLSPKIKPDIYTADRTRKTKWVTFYTDIDSIKIKVKPGTKYDFVVLLNGKDSCFTQIASAIPPGEPLQNAGRNDTIPFTLTSFYAIHVDAIINDTDTLNLHFDVGSFDFRLTKDAIVKKTSLLSNQPDALAGKINPNYNNLNKVFKLQMGTVIWNNPNVSATGVTSTGMDGRFGWNLFEGKQVEIDYDNYLLIIHAKLPKKSKDYAKSKLEFIRSFVCMKAKLKIEDKEYDGNFLLDTGSDQAIILDSAWSAKQNFPKDLKVIKSSVIRDPRGVEYETRTVLFPQLKVNSFNLTNIPTLVLRSKNPIGIDGINYFGNDLLKRFNIILDFRNDCIYVKPNKLVGVKYRESS